MTEENAIALPQYQCHKKVWALKIDQINEDACTLTFVDSGHAPICTGYKWFSKHNPQPGGYYVVYPDGYTSFSPAQAFEEGYARL